MLELNRDKLVFSFPEVHKDAVCRVSFQRTLRIPDDNREYGLPPGLGNFPMEHVEDHSARLPQGWGAHGGVLLPMYQAEALWIRFDCPRDYPFAVKIAAGKINAVTGEPWKNGLSAEPQDYVVLPDQPWLDGFSVSKGQIRQFVAMPLGAGYTAEEQLTGAAEHGGLQIIAYPMKKAVYEEMRRKRMEDVRPYAMKCCLSVAAAPAGMGLAPGGLMRQEIYEDDYGIDVWDTSAPTRCFVHILNSAQWTAATGKPTPGKAPTAREYTDAGLPWFEYYADKPALQGSKILAGLDSVAAKGVKKGETSLPENDPVNPKAVAALTRRPGTVSDGAW